MTGLDVIDKKNEQADKKQPLKNTNTATRAPYQEPDDKSHLLKVFSRPRFAPCVWRSRERRLCDSKGRLYESDTKSRLSGSPQIF